jgi:inosine-uridine nucleoside N-ribohydrolase
MKIHLVLMLILVMGGCLSRADGAERQKIIFDCDLAGDVDDAFALALILASPEFEVLGIVMDHGYTEKRAQVACRVLYETGREDIPVVVGRKTGDGISHQFSWGAGFEKLKPIRTPGADFIIEKLRAFPNQIVLITVGPVPNMADIIDKDPEALKLAKHIYAMFGSFYMGYDEGPIPSPEWNVRADVPASKKYVASGAPITYAGLDITTFVRLTEEYRNRIFLRRSPLTDALSSLYTLWRYEGYAEADCKLYDAVAVGMVLWPELFTTRKAHVKVTDEGYTVIDESKAPNCEIGMTINEDEFLARLTARYLHQNLMR